ncbi:MAG: SDR family NAD(P)-dependent oxidoreductase [Bacteroidota bacterium]
MKKTILITGSTDGIGKLAAIKLAQDGHEVYLHGRNSEKLEKVIAEIKAAFDNEHISGFVADFSDLAAVKNMAIKVQNELTKLDVLINNAGVYKSKVSQTNDGLDIRFTVNYFAPYVLTNELMPLLKKGAAPRVINLSSAAQAPVSMEAMKGNKPLGEMAAYSQSKLALSMWSTYLAEKEPDLVVIPVNPGSLLNTNMVREGWGFHRSSADKGANILYDLAISEQYTNDSGKYFDNDLGAFGSLHPAEKDSMVIQMLIKQTEELLN